MGMGFHWMSFMQDPMSTVQPSALPYPTLPYPPPYTDTDADERGDCILSFLQISCSDLEHTLARDKSEAGVAFPLGFFTVVSGWIIPLGYQYLSTHAFPAS